MNKMIEILVTESNDNTLTTQQKREALESLRRRLVPFEKKVIVRNEKGHKRVYRIAYGKYTWHRTFNISIQEERNVRKALHYPSLTDREVDILYSFFFEHHLGEYKEEAVTQP